MKYSFGTRLMLGTIFVIAMLSHFIKLLFLNILTLGYYSFSSYKKSKNINPSDSLTVADKSSLNLNKLILYLNGEEIVDVTNTHTKVKIFFKSTSKIDSEKIKTLKGISGIFVSSKSLTIVTGNSASLIKEELLKLK